MNINTLNNNYYIVVNARFLTQKLTGVQRFAIEMSLQLKKLYGDSIAFVSPQNVIHTDIADKLKAKVIGKRKGHAWEQIDLPNYLRSQGKPLLLCLGNTAPLLYKNLVVTLHDITFKRFPNTFSWKFRQAYGLMIPVILKHARFVFSVSKFSVDEISDYYGYPKERMDVVYNAVDTAFKPILDEKLRSDNYLFAVSSVKENKNFIVALEAFLKAQDCLPNIKMYIVGDLSSSSFKTLDFSKYANNPNIKFLGRVSDRDLIRYYSNAQAFIFPSLYEGFGIPVLEAEACGCPVISSNSSSLPEVLDDSAILCNPLSVDEFKHAIVSIYNSLQFAKSLVSKGYANVLRFSWQQSAEVMKKRMDELL